MRLFVAIEIPEHVRQELASWWTEASLCLPDNEWRDIPTQNWHVTLAFYGQVNGLDVDALAEELAVCAAKTEPICLEIQDFGTFPRAARPRVFWAGIRMVAEAGMAAGIAPEKQAKGLKNLARCCRRAGHATLRKRTAKERSFRGHITLARSGDFATPLTAECWQALPDMPQLAWTAASLTLFASKLRPEGAQYQRVEEFTFEGR